MHDSVDVELPESTPYEGPDQDYYLRGYAVGQTAYANGHFACHSNTTDARQHKAWNDGWETGFRDRKANSRLAMSPAEEHQAADDDATNGPSAGMSPH